MTVGKQCRAGSRCEGVESLLTRCSPTATAVAGTDVARTAKLRTKSATFQRHVHRRGHAHLGHRVRRTRTFHLCAPSHVLVPF